MKYLVFSIDDGTVFDKKSIEIFDKYGVHATFNLNSGMDDFVWYFNDEIPIRRLILKDNVALYKNHEVASHSLTHPYLDSCDEQEVIRQVNEDINNLENIFHRKITSFATPFRTSGNRETDIIKNNCSVNNIRISCVDESMEVPSDLYNIKITALDINRAFELLPEFLNRKEGVFIYAGHSYDFEVKTSFERLEEFIKEVLKHDDIKIVTMSELVDILKKS